MVNFTQPAAIKIESEDQRDRLIKGLEGLGYTGRGLNESHVWLHTLPDSDDFVRSHHNSYNAEQIKKGKIIPVKSEAAFLALAAMTDAEGIVGEYWFDIESGTMFSLIPGQYDPYISFEEFCRNVIISARFRKATAAEIMEHFGENMSEEKEDRLTDEVRKEIARHFRNHGDVTQFAEWADILDPQLAPPTLFYERTGFGHNTLGTLTHEEALANRNVYASIAESEAHEALRQLQIKRDAYNGQPLAEWLKWDESGNIAVSWGYGEWCVTNIADCVMFYHLCFYFRNLELARCFLSEQKDLLNQLMPLIKGV